MSQFESNSTHLRYASPVLRTGAHAREKCVHPFPRLEVTTYCANGQPGGTSPIEKDNFSTLRDQSVTSSAISELD